MGTRDHHRHNSVNFLRAFAKDVNMVSNFVSYTSRLCLMLARRNEVSDANLIRNLQPIVHNYG